MDAYDSVKIAELHRLAWNTGEVPLLFIVLPNQLLIYNNYVPPRNKSDGQFDEAECIKPNELIEILQSCIFGIDCNDEAIRIAPFSLSLAMSDFLEP
jgi:hypothetical protein